MTLCAVLVGEPWHLSLQQIGDLTPWQTQRIYSHPRDKHGRILPYPKAGSEKEADAALLRAWREQQDKAGASPEETEKQFAALLLAMANSQQPPHLRDIPFNNGARP